jgi:hypothetical protein
VIVGRQRVDRAQLPAPQPLSAQGTRSSLTSSGLFRMAAVAEQSRFSSPSGTRLPGKLVSSSMNGMMNRRAEAAENWGRVGFGISRVAERAQGRGVTAARLLIGSAESATPDWLPGLHPSLSVTWAGSKSPEVLPPSRLGVTLPPSGRDGRSGPQAPSCSPRAVFPSQTFRL